jgi:hypothetical protein
MTVITALQRLRQEDKVLPELHGETLSQKNKTNKQKKNTALRFYLTLVKMAVFKKTNNK